MSILKVATAAALLVFSISSFAAKPTSIVFNANAETSDGNEPSSPKATKGSSKIRDECC